MARGACQLIKTPGRRLGTQSQQTAGASPGLSYLRVGQDDSVPGRRGDEASVCLEDIPCQGHARLLLETSIRAARRPAQGHTVEGPQSQAARSWFPGEALVSRAPSEKGPDGPSQLCLGDPGPCQHHAEGTTRSSDLDLQGPPGRQRRGTGRRCVLGMGCSGLGLSRRAEKVGT